MANKIILKENGLINTPNTPTGYKYFGYNGTVISEKSGATVSAISSGDWLEVVINISSSQLLNMNTTPIELLPAPGSGKYYDIDVAIFETYYNTTQYNVSGPVDMVPYLFPLYMVGPGAYDDHIPASFFNIDGNIVRVIRPQLIYVDLISLISSLPVTLGNSTFTNGDGTLKVILVYRVRTFG